MKPITPIEVHAPLAKSIVKDINRIIKKYYEYGKVVVFFSDIGVDPMNMEMRYNIGINYIRAGWKKVEFMIHPYDSDSDYEEWAIILTSEFADESA